MAFWQVLILLSILFAYLVHAQPIGWIDGQINTTMSAVVRDTFYINGGYLWWSPGMSDGTYGQATADYNTLIYAFNFSTAFNYSQNISNIFTTQLTTTFNGTTIPQYISGAMFANDYKLFLYGGLLLDLDGTTSAANTVYTFNLYPSETQNIQSHLEFVDDTISPGTTQYVANGASVNAPSENLGFYFGGLRAPNFGETILDSMNDTVNVESSTLIQLNITGQENAAWLNISLPASVPPRANAEIVWVPISDHGILVTIGGVINPAFANINETDNPLTSTQNFQTSQTFMSTVSIYDITRQQWYEQVTAGDIPSVLTQGCSVLASAQDGSSHNIYWYGGFNGYNMTASVSDDVWVLSIPSFIWTKLYSGIEAYGRAGHVCAKPYPDQLVVIGGYTSFGGTTLTCLPEFARVFNLSSGTWLDGYDPAIWGNYSVPSAIFSAVGGDATGGATQTVPTPLGFSNSNLSSLFRESYDISKITTYYPYTAASRGRGNNTPLPTLAMKSPTKPKYIGPVLGVILGILFIITPIVIWFWRRPLLRTCEGLYSYTHNDEILYPLGGMRGRPAVEIEGNGMHVAGGMTIHETGGTAIHEMMDSASPAELDSSCTRSEFLILRP